MSKDSPQTLQQFRVRVFKVNREPAGKEQAKFEQRNKKCLTFYEGKKKLDAEKENNYLKRGGPRSPRQNSKGEPKSAQKPLQELLKFSSQMERCQNIEQTENSHSQILSEDLKTAFHHLFNLYIKEEILKHHCSRKDWKFERRLIDTIIKPAIDILLTDKQSKSSLFEPYLRQISCMYLLHSPLDTYSRLSSSLLLMQITETWLKVRQAEKSLKKLLRQNLEWFRDNFFRQDISTCEQQVLERKKLYLALFERGEKNRPKMVDLIKVYIFCEKSFGADFSINLEEWVNQF